MQQERESEEKLTSDLSCVRLQKHIAQAIAQLTKNDRSCITLRWQKTIHTPENCPTPFSIKP